MGMVRSYRDLEVWKRAMDVCVRIYQATGTFPASEMYGLTNQMRRSAVSIASNIAEGHARSRKDYGRFLRIAYGSLNELETQLELSLRIGFLSPEIYQEITNELAILGRQLNALMRKIKD
jgi:four helix bundle protein